MARDEYELVVHPSRHGLRGRRMTTRGEITRSPRIGTGALGLRDRVLERCSAAPPPAPAHITNAFWNACRGGQRATAELLLERGADAEWVGHDGKTPIDVAQESGDDDLVRWLRSRGSRGAAAPK